VFLDYRRWSSFYESGVLQFCLNGSCFLTNSRDFLIQPLAFARLFASRHSDKKFA